MLTDKTPARYLRTSASVNQAQDHGMRLRRLPTYRRLTVPENAVVPQEHRGERDEK